MHFVKKIDTLLAFCLKKLKHFLQLFENQKNIYLSYMFQNYFSKFSKNVEFILVIFGNFVNISEKIDGISKVFIEKLT